MKSYLAHQRDLGIERCNDWAGNAVRETKPERLLDVGCGDGSLLQRYFPIPGLCELHGIEGEPNLARQARKRNMTVAECDINGQWPYAANTFDAVFSSQTIEHLHNTRFFVEEMFRVLKPCGTAIVTSENLCSLLNCAALCFGYTPFSLTGICGRYLGNPIGLHYRESLSPLASHIRVMTVRQAKELFELAGFETEASSMAILPLPDRLSRCLESFVKCRGHYLRIKAVKPK